MAEQQKASSSSTRNEFHKPDAKASGERLQPKENDNEKHLLSTDVNLISNVVTRVEENLSHIFGSFT